MCFKHLAVAALKLITILVAVNFILYYLASLHLDLDHSDLPIGVGPFPW